MKKLIKMLPPKAITAMLVAAVLLLLSGSVGGTRAALTYYSDTYSSRVSMQNIGVTLLESWDGENWEKVSWRNYDGDNKWDEGNKPLLEGMRIVDGVQEDLKIGKKYTEQLKVRNTGTIGEYVRVTIYKYWVDAEGNKVSAVQEDEDTTTPEESEDTSVLNTKKRMLDPEVIQLNLANTNVWIEDTDASTTERKVLYYNQLLPVGGETPIFTDSLKIDQKIVKMVSETVTTNGDTTTIKSTYDYDGKRFQIEVEVDAVQEHNAEDAILSAWGRNVTVRNETLTLN